MGRRRIVLSLHGSLFMHWPDHSLEARLFVWLLAQAGTVTVLGEKQRERLLQMGATTEKVRVVVNSCELEPLDSEALAAKVNRGNASDLHLLYLSSLIDTKGYPEFLEALRALARSRGRRIEAVLCGRLLNAEQNERFSSSVEAEAWIEQILTEINRSERVSVRWVKGAMGEERRRLFHEADVFVLPTHYAVEAQPLVLLEAMASGCAIVTTQVGEIPTILDERSACLLRDPSVAELARVLDNLCDSPGERERIARQAHQRFLDRYRIERHIDAWEEILNDCFQQGTQ
jgi:glycosyltransferase involved in cell wall biosynthesis